MDNDYLCETTKSANQGFAKWYVNQRGLIMLQYDSVLCCVTSIYPCLGDGIAHRLALTDVRFVGTVLCTIKPCCLAASVLVKRGTK